MDIPGIRADETAVVLSGQPFALAVQIEDDAAALQVLDGRSFALIFRPTRGTASIIDPPVTAGGSGTSVALAYGGADTATIAAALRSQAGRCEVVEIVGGESVRVFDWPVLAELAATFDGGQPGSGDLPQTLVVVQPATGRVTVSQQGAAGASSAAAAQSLILAGQAKAAADAAAATASGAAAIATTAAAAAQAAIAGLATSIKSTGDRTDRTAAVQALLPPNGGQLTFQPGEYWYASVPYTGNSPAPIINLNGRTDWVLQAAGTRHVSMYDPLDPDHTLRPFCTAQGCARFKVLGHPVGSHWPPPTVALTLKSYSIANGTLDVTPDTGNAPMWPTMDDLTELDPVTGAVLNRQYANSQYHTNVATYSIVPIDGQAQGADGTYRITIPSLESPFAQVTSLSRLTVYSPSHGQQDGDLVTATCNDATLQAFLDGLQPTFRISVPDADHIELLIDTDDDGDDDDPVDATGHTSLPIGQISGTIKRVRVQSWMANVGARLAAWVRKRSSAFWNFSGQTGACEYEIAGGGTVGNTVSATGMENVRHSVKTVIPPGYVFGGTCAAILSDVRGDFRYSHDVELTGDDGFNTSTTLWSASVIAWGTGGGLAANQLQVGFRLTLNGNGPTPPRRRDRLYFLNPQNQLVAAPRITAYDGGQVVTLDFAGFPAGFDPATWRIMPIDSASPRIICDKHRARNITGRGLIIGGQNARYRDLQAEGCRASAIRAQFPASGAHLKSGAFLGGAVASSVTAINCSVDDQSSSAAVITMRSLPQRGASLARTGLPVSNLGDCLIDGYGWAAVILEGFDLILPSLNIRNKGRLRSTRSLTGTDNRLFDLNVRQATLLIPYAQSDSDILINAGPGSVARLDKVGAGTGVQYVRDPTATIIIEGSVQQ